MDFGSAKRPKRGLVGKRPLLTNRQQRNRIQGINGKRNFGERGEGFDDVLSAKYPHSVQFYDALPGGSISLVDFEASAVERLRVLRAVEKLGSSSVIKYSKDWAQKLEAELRKDPKTMPFTHSALSRGPDMYYNREKDHFSHFILRLAYCKAEELRRWFITQETDLFRYRCILASSELKNVVETNELNYETVSPQEMEEFGSVLRSLAFKGFSNERPSDFYKVPFTEAPDLVRSRKVMVKGGFCYVPDTELISLMSWVFRSLLSQALLYTFKFLPRFDEDERLLQMLGDLDRRYTGVDYAKGTDGQMSVKPEMIRGLADKSFPMCMKAMQFTLNQTHHLKYKARLQYGLFLKGIGLSLDDAIRFFRGEFAQSHVTAEKFDKEYTYGIRYNYGKEGKKVSWAPWNCMKIIMDSVGPGEAHGCPYRHYDQKALRDLLVKSGLEGQELNEVMNLSKEGHCQKACAAQFKATHAGAEISTGMVNHPNQYYMESITGGVTAKTSKTTLKTEKACLYNKTN